MLDGSNVPYVERANPEDFIHLFLNNSKRLVEFIEHLVKVLSFANFCIMADLWISLLLPCVYVSVHSCSSIEPQSE
jgi:hypothetical protein